MVSIDVEQSVLGGLLLDSSRWSDVAAIVREKDFARQEHALIFGAIRALNERNAPADVLTVSEALREHGTLDKAGGLAYLGELAKNTPSAANVKAYADLLRQGADRQTARNLLQGAVSALNGNGSVADTLVSLQRTLGELNNHHATVETFTAAELQHMELRQVKPPLVHDVIHEGVTICAGKPKIGKSWFALGTGAAVASGGKALGSIDVAQGDVLVLALEDTKRRLHKRMAVLYGSESWPPALTIATDWPRMDEGGLAALDKWLREHPSARLVVIDTLARFRPPRGDHAYDDDYLVATHLKTLSDHYSIAILLLHHLRKMHSEDPLECVSGTFGLTGAVDGVLVMQRQRGRADATLFVSGRDLEERELALRWEAAYGMWKIMGDAEDYRRTEHRQEIVEVLNQSTEALGPKAIADALGRDYNATKVLLGQMLKAGDIRQPSRGKYEPAEKR